MHDEGQDSKTVYSFARIDFCSKYITFALLERLSTQTFVLLPLELLKMKIQKYRRIIGEGIQYKNQETVEVPEGFIENKSF